MDGIHDLGGRQGFGPVDLEEEEAALAERWQGFVFALTGAMARAGVMDNTDHFRHAVERIKPAAYLTDSYYGRWLGGAETLLIEAGVISAEELDARVLAGGAQAAPSAAQPRPEPDHFPPRNPQVKPPATAQREPNAPSKFSQGDRVRTRRSGSRGHTRLPAYARGCVGSVVATHGNWVLPDSNAHALGEKPEPLYTVLFQSSELFGADAEEGVDVCLDLFESYLLEIDE